MASDQGSFAYNGLRMTTDQQPQGVFYLDLMNVLRAFGDRQREMVTVIRRLRLEGSPPSVTPAPMVKTSSPALEPPAPVPSSPESVSPPAQQGPGPLDIADLVRRTRRRYDYFEDLDVRLSGLRRSPDSDTA
jgi:hypothetical protein